MKVFLFFLCSVNLVFGVYQWVQTRDDTISQEYVEASDVQQLELLNVLVDESDSAVDRCIAIGPYSDKEDAELIRSTLFGAGFVVDLHKKSMEKAPTYWVHYKVIEGEESIKDVQQRLYLNGMGSYVISQGNLKGRLSVGVFENIDLAEGLLKKLNSLGYQAEMSTIPGQSSQYWVLVELLYSVENQRKIESFLSGRNEGFEMRQIFCKSVASEK